VALRREDVVKELEGIPRAADVAKLCEVEVR
jgi:hypothetical protein